MSSGSLNHLSNMNDDLDLGDNDFDQTNDNDFCDDDDDEFAAITRRPMQHHFDLNDDSNLILEAGDDNANVHSIDNLKETESFFNFNNSFECTNQFGVIGSGSFGARNAASAGSLFCSTSMGDNNFFPNDLIGSTQESIIAINNDKSSDSVPLNHLNTSGDFFNNSLTTSETGTTVTTSDPFAPSVLNHSSLLFSENGLASIDL